MKNAECMKEVEEARLQVSRFLQSQNQSSGRRRYVTPPQQIAAFNRFIIIASHFPFLSVLAFSNNNYCVGELLVK